MLYMQVLESMCHKCKGMLEDKQPSQIIHISVSTREATPVLTMVIIDLMSTAALTGHRIVMLVHLQNPMAIHTVATFMT